MSRLYEGTLHVDNINVRLLKIANISHALPVPVNLQPISHGSEWSFRVYMIPLHRNEILAPGKQPG